MSSKNQNKSAENKTAVHLAVTLLTLALIIRGAQIKTKPFKSPKSNHLNWSNGTYSVDTRPRSHCKSRKYQNLNSNSFMSNPNPVMYTTIAERTISIGEKQYDF